MRKLFSVTHGCVYLYKGLKPNYSYYAKKSKYKYLLYYNDINLPITRDKIILCIREMKNNKACGGNRAINEYIKYTVGVFLPFYKKVFNMMFDTGIIPSKWLMAI